MRRFTALHRTTLALVVVLSASVGVDGCGGADELPEVLVVRPFSLVDQRGEPFHSRELEGKVWVASFIFTSCRNICPMLTSQVSNLARRLEDRQDLRFVSISVDPEVDTPERLAAYADRYGADPARWRFLTGPRDDVRRVVTTHFRVSMGERRDDPRAGYDIPHSDQLLLVDQAGVLRGAYATDRAGLDRLAGDVDRLLAASRE